MVTRTSHRTNKIIEINDKHAYTLIEPDITHFRFLQLYQGKGYNLLVDIHYLE